MSANYNSMPLVIESLEDNNVISLEFILGTLYVYISYSPYDDDSFDDEDLYETTDLITLNAGDKIYIERVDVVGYRDLLDCGVKFKSTGKFNVYGNMDNVITSYTVRGGVYNNIAPFWFWKSKVVDASNLSMGTNFGDYAYYMFFADCKYLTSPPSLPATSLTPYCYAKMFYWSTHVDIMPQLPATTLAPYCYYGMFRSCDGMISVPKLPATTLAEGCYFGMFADCEKIRNIVNVAAKNLEKNCYDYMFYNCETVNSIHARMTEVPDKKNTYNWTLGVRDRGVFTLNSHATWEKHGPHYIPDNWTLNYDGNTDYANMPLTIETEGFEGMGAQIGVQFNTGTTYVELDIIYNEGEDDEDEQIVQLSSSNDNIITLPQFHDRLAIKSITVQSNSVDIDDWGSGFSFTSTKPINVMGNMRKTTISYTYRSESYTHAVPYLFSKAPVLNANHLILDYNMDPYCYIHMFDGCLDLLNAPYLSATTLTESCYSNMFEGCVKMKYSPELFATTLESSCYMEMFKNCSSLLYAPLLPATTLEYACYEGMFSGCTSLGSAPTLPATTLANRCYLRMFEGCTKLTSCPALPATTLNIDCYGYMFSNCIGLTSFPQLPATVAKIRCYDHMFYNCRKVKYSNTLSIGTLAQDCFRSMYSGCSSLVDIPQLVCTTLATGCYENMFENCTSLTNAGTLPATTLDIACYADMFKGCTNLTTAPILNAPNLVSRCYPSMFNGCKKLNYIKAMFYDKPSYVGTTDWLKDVAETGTFAKPVDAFWNVRNATGIPKGWNIEYVGTLDYTAEYLIIESLEDDNIIQFGMTDPNEYNQQYNKTIEYSTDKTNWETANSINWDEQDLRTKLATLHKGDRLLLRGTENSYSTGVVSKIFASKKYKVYGNIMSLFYGANFFGQTAFPGQGNSKQLQEFFADTPLVDASNLKLAATTLSLSCYYRMFLNCIELTAAPALPATTLVAFCYAGMFQGCTKLTTAPNLPATTLANYCYQSMFQNCISLVNPPVLNVTTLRDGCYKYMFAYCTSLTTAPNLPATALVNQCYDHMFFDCNSLNEINADFLNAPSGDYMYYWVYHVAATGTFTPNQNITWTPEDYVGDSGIPEGWTFPNSLETQYFTMVAKNSDYITFNIPEEIPTSVFTSISYSTDNGTTWTTTNNVDNQTVSGSLSVNEGDRILWKGTGKVLCYNLYSISFGGWVDYDLRGNIMSLLNGDNFYQSTLDTNYTGHFNTLFINNERIISAVNLILPATTLTQNCYANMFYNCSNMTAAPKILATTLANGCCTSMFQNCTSLTATPALPATTLADNCYSNMFYGCTALQKALSLPATTLADGCYSNMFQGCTSLYKSPDLNAPTLANRCYKEMFNGCTNLKRIKMMATNISATDSLTNWVNNVATYGIFTRSSEMTSLPTGPNGIPRGWTTIII